MTNLCWSESHLAVGILSVSSTLLHIFDDVGYPGLCTNFLEGHSLTSFSCGHVVFFSLSSFWRRQFQQLWERAPRTLLVWWCWLAVRLLLVCPFWLQLKDKDTVPVTCLCLYIGWLCELRREDDAKLVSNCWSLSVNSKNCKKWTNIIKCSKKFFQIVLELIESNIDMCIDSDNNVLTITSVTSL